MFLSKVVGLPPMEVGLHHFVWSFLSGEAQATRRCLQGCKHSTWSVFYKSLLDFSEQNWTSALEGFRDVFLKGSPEFLKKRSCFFLSYILTRQGNLESSEELALQLRDDFQFRVIAGNILGFISYQKAKYEDSCNNYDLVLQIDPENPTANNGKACALLRIIGKENLAGKYIRKALQKYPEKGEYLHTFGCFLLQQGRVTEGFSTIRKSFLLRNKKDPPCNTLQSK